jgi:hypothetical protein
MSMPDSAYAEKRIAEAQYAEAQYAERTGDATPGAIPEALDRQHALLNELEQVLDLLSGKLRPILHEGDQLTPVGLSLEPGVKESVSPSPQRQFIEERNEHIRLLTRRLRATINSVEL